MGGKFPPMAAAAAPATPPEPEFAPMELLLPPPELAGFFTWSEVKPEIS